MTRPKSHEAIRSSAESSMKIFSSFLPELQEMLKTLQNEPDHTFHEAEDTQENGNNTNTQTEQKSSEIKPVQNQEGANLQEADDDFMNVASAPFDKSADVPMSEASQREGVDQVDPPQADASDSRCS